MVNTQAGNTLSSTLPSIEGGKGSRPKTPQITTQQMINNPFYYQSELEVFDQGTSDISLDPDAPVKQNSVPETFYRDTTDINLDPDVIPQHEDTLKHEVIIDNSGQEQVVEVKGFSANGTMYLRAETESGRDMNEVAENKPWYGIDKLGNFVELAKNQTPGMLKVAGESLIDAGADLFKQTTGFGQEKPPAPQSPKEREKAEKAQKQQLAVRQQEIMNDILSMPKHEVKVVQVGDRPISLEEVNKLRKVSVDFKGDIQANGQLTTNAETEAEKAMADQAKQAAKAAQTPFAVANARIGKMSGVDLEAVGEGGKGRGGLNISATGGGAVG